MPAWEDYKAEAKARGALALELYVCQSTPAVDPVAMKANLPDHLAYQGTLEKAGSLVFAGPLSDESGDNMLGTGMIVYRAASMAEATALAEQDPMHATGSRTFTLRKWLINEGSFTLSVKLAGQSISMS